MSDALKSSRAKIRTFAHDLAAERQRREGGQSEIPKADTAPVAATSDVKKIAREDDDHQMGAVKEPRLIPQEKPEPKKITEDTPKQKRVPEPIKIVEPTKKDLPAMPETPTRGTTIPSFHELQKAVAKDEKKKPNIGYDATVITDTKHKRFRLFPALTASIGKWFKNLTKKKKKNKHTYSVPETSHRKGVIQKATTKSGAIFSADSDTIKEHIRKRRQKEDEKAPEKKEDEPETTWSPFTETGYALLDDEEETVTAPAPTKNVTVEYKKISEAPHVVATPPPAPEPEPEPVEEELIENEPAPEPETKNLEEELDEDRWSNVEPTTEPEPVTEEVVEPEPETPAEPEQTSKETEGGGLLHQFDTNTLTLVLVVMVVGFVAILLISRAVIDYLNQPEEVVSLLTELSSSEPVLSGAQVLALKVNNDTVNRLPAEANEAATEAPVGLVEIPVVSPIGDEISPSYFFELMRFKTTPPLRQVVTTARFVTVNRNVPAVILHFTDIETTRGEMLQWEASLAEDFARLYDLPATDLGSFEDTAIEGSEVRSISYEGKRVLIYGFIGSNTLLISDDAATFAQIQQLANKD